jgi:hypothetical protein
MIACGFVFLLTIVSKTTTCNAIYSTKECRIEAHCQESGVTYRESLTCDKAKQPELIAEAVIIRNTQTKLATLECTEN